MSLQHSKAFSNRGMINCGRFDIPTDDLYFTSMCVCFQEYRSFDQIRTKMEGKSSSNLKEINLNKTDSDNNFDQYEKYPLHILKASSENLPTKIDPLRKEVSKTQLLLQALTAFF